MIAKCKVIGKERGILMDYVVVRSSRKTMAITVTPDLRVVVKAPKRISEEKISEFVKREERWILDTIDKYKAMGAKQPAGAIETLSDKDIKELAEKALKAIPARVKYWAGIMGVTYGRITIRNQRTRWGSCSSRGNLNFNCLLMLVPEDVLDYVIVHELAHRKEMNHSSAFWAEVARILPNYGKPMKWLKEHGTEIMLRMTSR